MNDETGLSKIERLVQLLLVKYVYRYFYLSKILPAFIRTKIFVDVIVDMYMFFSDFLLILFSKLLPILSIRPSVHTGA
jgi:hypothetical protein